MNKVKLSSILALVLILFLSLAVVSANDVSNVTFTEDSVIDNSNSISNYLSNNSSVSYLDSNLISDLDSNLSSKVNLNSNSDDKYDISESINQSIDDSFEELITNSNELDNLNTLKINLSSFYEKKDNLNNSDKLNLDIDLIKNSTKIQLKDSTIITITDSTYSNYFDLSKNGAIIEGTLKDGDILKIGNVSNKIFEITKQLTLIPLDNESLMSNCLIRLLEGSSGTVLNNLTIINKDEKIKSYYLAAIHIYNSTNNSIINLNINTSMQKCYGIIMSNASYNEIVNNTIIMGSATAIPITGSSYNLFKGNYIETNNTNMIYYSMFGNGDFMPLDNLEKSHDNIIANNYFTSRNGKYDSYCYAVHLMNEAGGSNTIIANNIFDNVFRAISVLTDDTLVINNRITNVGGEAGILVEGNNVSVINNTVSTEKAEIIQWNPSGEVLGIKTSGDNTQIINNTIYTNASNGITSTGDYTVIINNTIFTENSNCINITWSNALIENNTLNGYNASAIKIFTSKLIENTTIRNNIILSDIKAIVLQGKLNYNLVCDNIINVSNVDESIVIAKYTNRNPISPEHYAVYNNIINGILINLTSPSEIERNETGNGSNIDNSSGNISGNTTNNAGVDNSTGNTTNNTGVDNSTGNTTNGTVIDNSTTNQTDISGSGNGTNTDINSTGNSTNIENNTNLTKLATVINIYNATIIRTNYLDVYLLDENGYPISNQIVLFNVFNKTYAKTTDSEGKASLQFNAALGNYTVNINYAGNNYNTSQISDEVYYLASNITTNLSVVPLYYYVNESNFNSFFDKDGYILSDYKYSTLIFSGNFTNKRIILNKEASLVSDSAVLFDSIIKIESDKCVVDGFKIINSNPGNIEDNHRFAILLDNVEKVSIINNNIKLDSYNSGYGIYLSESNKNTILNNTIDLKANKLTFGIILYDSNNNKLQNNSVKVNGTSNPHTYESTIQVDTSISVDDYEAEGMIIPEVYKTYGIILFYSSSNNIAYNIIKGSSGLTKYYTAVKESTNSIVAIDLYYDSNNNKVHHNNVNVTAKDPYIYGLGVLGAETGKRDQFSANNSFTDNNVFLNGTYYVAGLIAGYNSINTTMLRNNLSLFSNNVSYGAILEGAESSKVDSNSIKSRSRINYVLEGYDTDNNIISRNVLDASGRLVGDINLYNSKYNSVVNNTLSPIFNNPNVIELSPNLLDLDLTDHADVIAPHTSPYYDEGGEGNVFEGNVVGKSSSGGNGSNGGNSAGGGSSSGGNSNSNSNSTAVNSNSGDGSSGSQSNIDGSGNNLESSVTEGNTVGTTSSEAVTESTNAYNLEVDENSASSRSLSFGGMNIPVLCILFLLIFACASELIKRSKRDLR